MKSAISHAAALLAAAMLLFPMAGCTGHRDTEDTVSCETVPSETVFATDDGKRNDSLDLVPPWQEEAFVFPRTDGSTSTINLDRAARRAILGDDSDVAHSKTYTALMNLAEGGCDMIFTTPLSETQIAYLQEHDYAYEAAPVAGEGFVFVVNRDNPVDTLTTEQIKKIYSGEITNWSEVGGRDAEIIAYQRNRDSGSQNYMLSFMGDTPLMEPITSVVPATMSGILDVVANYQNGVDAIGYSVFAYSDGMYEDMAKIKYIKVDGVAPDLTTLADGSYPLLGYNYAVFSAKEPENSAVRAVVAFLQSDEGQRAVAEAGYVPYRQIDGLTLPEPTMHTLYHAPHGSAGKVRPEQMPDDYYAVLKDTDTAEDLPILDMLSDSMAEKVREFLDATERQMAEVDFTLFHTYGKWERSEPRRYIALRAVNGYLSVLNGWRYMESIEYSPFYFFAMETAVFDLYTEERLTLSDLFYDDVDFVPLLNAYLGEKLTIPYAGYGGAVYDLNYDFQGLREGEFSFTADSIIFKPNTCTVNGVEISLEELMPYMVIAQTRDMTDCIKGDAAIYRRVRIGGRDIHAPEMRDEIPLWFLDPEKSPLTREVTDRVNAFVEELYREHLSEEARRARTAELIPGDETAGLGSPALWPDVNVTLYGTHYVEISGPNMLWTEEHGEIGVSIEGRFAHPYYFVYYLNAQTGEALRLCDLLYDGWEAHAEYAVTKDNAYENQWTAYTGGDSFAECPIVMCDIFPYRINGAEEDVPYILVAGDAETLVRIRVPMEYYR